MKKYNDIGDLFRDKLSGYSPEPPADVWNNIQGKAKGKNPLWKILGLPVVGAIIIGLTTYLLLTNQQTEPSANLLVENNQTTIATDNGTTTINTIPNPEESSTNETSAQNTTSNTVVSMDNQSNTTNLQNQELVLVQSKEETTTNSFFDNSSQKNTSQSANTEKSPTKPTTETPRAEKPTSETNRSNTTQAKTFKPFIISKDTSICENTAAQLYLYNATNIRWSTGETKNKITVYPSYSERYSVSFTMENGKDTSVFVNVNAVECMEVHVPNMFTPDGDGVNDLYLAKANIEPDFFEMNIYTVGGKQLLFSSKNIRQGWDGTSRGQTQPHGVYFYIIRYKDSFGKIIEKRGELLLKLQ